MNIPKVGSGKFVLINIRRSTGHVLCHVKDEDHHCSTFCEDHFMAFEGIENAIGEAKLRVSKNDKIEVVIFDGKGEYLDVIRPD